MAPRGLLWFFIVLEVLLSNYGLVFHLVSDWAAGLLASLRGSCCKSFLSGSDDSALNGADLEFIAQIHHQRIGRSDNVEIQAATQLWQDIFYRLLQSGNQNPLNPINLYSLNRRLSHSIKISSFLLSPSHFPLTGPPSPLSPLPSPLCPLPSSLSHRTTHPQAYTPQPTFSSPPPGGGESCTLSPTHPLNPSGHINLHHHLPPQIHTFSFTASSTPRVKDRIENPRKSQRQHVETLFQDPVSHGFW